MDPNVAPYPPVLQALGTADVPFDDVLGIDDLPPGAMRRVSRGDLDILLAHTPAGIVATDDRCPHMSAPLSIGELEECVVSCPLHEGRFDLATGDPVQMPTTGGLDPDGRYHPTWSSSGRDAKVDPPGKKAEARRLTRVRRFRYYPVRIAGDRIEIALPPMPPG
jgi:nitrite reductase/ring-hydroxylating ferredoxin subunit